ncbi:MAG: sulfite exporter TauE/SafE family protein [Hyphomicrobium sp.]|nr:sulfite exporter TauE/SafE family protein [Hyphomicrobium sp.]
MWEDILLYVAVGFAAQMVDGAIGMAYGITSSTVLLSLGIAPATASACVHAAETFTTAVSGISHWKFGNIDWRLVRRLALPGAIGGGIGAYVLANVDGNVIKPYIAGYLVLMGLFILWKAISHEPKENSEPPKHVGPLGFFGGLVDSIGGGGWGPIVTTTLIGSGTTPRYAIGSVNLTEFFVTLTISATFLFTIGLELFPIIAGLLVGGVIAAPFAAYATKHLPDKVLMIIVGSVIVLLSLRTILISLH